MLELSKKLIELINKNKNINEICELLNLERQQVYKEIERLKEQKYEFEREYHYNGNMKYLLQKQQSNRHQRINLITKNTENKLTFMLISDIHYGNVNDRIDLLYKIYDYCNNKNIHIIINAGDLIDGISTGNNRRILTLEDQIKGIIKEYPFDNSILNFICLGNHDIESLQNKELELSTILNRERQDLIPLGYKLGCINVKNEKIYVNHFIKNFKTECISGNYFILKGHSHIASYTQKNGFTSIHIPTLSNLNNSEYCPFPGAMIMQLTFENGYFKEAHFDQLIIGDKIYITNHFDCELSLHHKQKDYILYEENNLGEYKIETNNEQEKKLTKNKKKT